MSNPLSIVHVLRAPVGGLFRHVRDLAAAQADAGHRVGVVVDRSAYDTLTAGHLSALERSLDLGLLRLAMPREPGPADARIAFEVSRQFARIGAAIVHGHGAKGGAYARLAARMIGRERRPRVFYTPHGGSLHFEPTSLKGRIFGALERQLAPWTDGIVFESRYAARMFQTRIGRAALAERIVPNGLGPADFEPVEMAPDAADIVYVGEMRDLKGVAVLLEALASLRAQGRILTARLVGDGPDRAVFEAKALSLGLGDSVVFPGAMPARDAFRRGRVLVVPSLAESFPYIVLEGLAAGRPLVATRVGGIPEMVAGLDHPLVEAGDAAALGEQIAAVHADLATGGGVTAARSQVARAHVRRSFSVEAMAGAIEDFYRSRLSH